MSLRVLFLSAIAAGLAACAATPPTTPAAFSAGDCANGTVNFDNRDVQCRIPAGVAGRFRFTANFSGGHDDTAARLEVSVNGAPFACEDGSKLFLNAEDGNVSLWCDLSTAGPIAAAGAFEVRIYHSHAEFVDYAVTPLVAVAK